jgi:phage major head subunit gpT-like protein
MIINKAALEGIQTTFKAIALRTFESAPKADLGGIVLDMPMSTGKLELDWVAGLGKMREWLGDRQARDLVAGNYSMTSKHYEHTVSVNRDAIEDDNLGQYGPQIRLISAGAIRFMDEVALGVLDNNATCWDGQPLVDDSHPAFGPYAAFDNKVTTTLTGDATGYANVLAAMDMMRAFADSEGRNLGLSAKALVVPLGLERIADYLVNNPVKPGTTNELNQLRTLKVVALPLADATHWYIVDTAADVAPVIRGIRKAPEFNSVTDPNDSSVFKSNEFLYGVDARLGAVPGFPQAIVGSIQ